MDVAKRACARDSRLFESRAISASSFSLVPNNDKSLLLINSGMAPMKKYFTGEEIPPPPHYHCQKCIRTPDLERVGHTARHGTFFEMLGTSASVITSKKKLSSGRGIPHGGHQNSGRCSGRRYTRTTRRPTLSGAMSRCPARAHCPARQDNNFWEHGRALRPLLRDLF